MDKADIKKKAASLLLKYSLTKPSLDDLVNVAEDQGYEIIDFDPTEMSDSLKLLVSRLSLHTQIQNNAAFTFRKGRIRLVFLRDNLNASEKLYALAHELGHIICGHLDHSTLDSRVEEEREANEFAHYLLDNSNFSAFRIWCKTNARMIIIAILALAVVVTSMVAFTYKKRQSSYYGNYYVTESGERYHQKNCNSIKDSKEISRLTWEDFKSRRYTACQICLSNK